MENLKRVIFNSDHKQPYFEVSFQIDDFLAGAAFKKGDHVSVIIQQLRLLADNLEKGVKVKDGGK